jgi:WD40 repeat protein
VWDLSDYGALSETTVTPEPGGAGGVNALCWVKDESVVSGWSDGFVRCHDASSMRGLWEIASAHRAAVTAVAVRCDEAASYLVSGGGDGSVRVWGLRSRELMAQFCEHHKAVTSVLVDARAPHLAHSAGLDCQVRETGGGGKARAVPWWKSRRSRVLSLPVTVPSRLSLSARPFYSPSRLPPFFARRC